MLLMSLKCHAKELKGYEVWLFSICCVKVAVKSDKVVPLVEKLFDL